MAHGRFSINICWRKGSRDTEMLGGREGKAGQYSQRKASEKMGINYF